MNTKTEILIGMAEVFGETLTDTRLRAYLKVLKQVTAEDLKRAGESILVDETLRRFPLPAQILAVCNPVLSPEEEAKEVAGRIIASVTKFGYSNQAEAREYIGNLGWEVVKMQGGWAELCRNMRNHMIPTLQAQYRELAITLRKKAIIGNLDTPPSLPESRQRPQLQSAGDILKKLPTMKDLE